MPHSSSTFDELCAHIVKRIAPRSVLDVGCGAGKYADLVRHHQPNVLLIGYEPDSSYVSRYDLYNKYDEVRCEGIENILTSNLQQRFDLCIFGDVIEHLRKSVGQDIIHFLLYRTRYLLLIVPLEYLQNDYAGVRTEAHISSWHPLEFQLFTDCAYIIQRSAWLGLLRGFLSSPTELRDLHASIDDLKNGGQYFARG